MRFDVSQSAKTSEASVKTLILVVLQCLSSSWVLSWGGRLICVCPDLSWFQHQTPCVPGDPSVITKMRGRITLQGA